MRSLMRSIVETRETISDLDIAYTIHPNKRYILGMIVGLAIQINVECDKPKSICDDVWNNLKKKYYIPREHGKKINRSPERVNELLDDMGGKYDIFPDKDYLLGMSAGLIYQVYAQCKKPLYMSDERWNELKKEAEVDLKKKRDLREKLKKKIHPNNIRDVLMNPYDDEE